MTSDQQHNARMELLAVIRQCPALVLDEQLGQMVLSLSWVNRRLPLLKTTDTAIRNLQAVRNTELEPRFRNQIRNNALLDMLRDSFAMLVIDLASIREGLVEDRGVLSRLRDRPDLLRRETAERVAPITAVVLHGPDTDGEVIADSYFRGEAVRAQHEAFERLFPKSGVVATRADVEGLIERFIKDTKAIMNDRNHVRAHRYEYRQGDRFRHFIDLDKLPAQIKVIESVVRDLALVLSSKSWSTDLRYNGHDERTAQDIADILLFGSINEAVNRMMRVERTTANPSPWYYRQHEIYLAGNLPHQPPDVVPRERRWFRRVLGRVAALFRGSKTRDH